MLTNSAESLKGLIGKSIKSYHKDKATHIDFTGGTRLTLTYTCPGRPGTIVSYNLDWMLNKLITNIKIIKGSYPDQAIARFIAGKETWDLRIGTYNYYPEEEGITTYSYFIT